MYVCIYIYIYIYMYVCMHNKGFRLRKYSTKKVTH